MDEPGWVEGGRGGGGRGQTTGRFSRPPPYPTAVLSVEQQRVRGERGGEDRRRGLRGRPLPWSSRWATSRRLSQTSSPPPHRSPLPRPVISHLSPLSPLPRPSPLTLFPDPLSLHSLLSPDTSSPSLTRRFLIKWAAGGCGRPPARRTLTPLPSRTGAASTPPPSARASAAAQRGESAPWKRTRPPRRRPRAYPGRRARGWRRRWCHAAPPPWPRAGPRLRPTNCVPAPPRRMGRGRPTGDRCGTYADANWTRRGGASRGGALNESEYRGRCVVRIPGPPLSPQPRHSRAALEHAQVVQGGRRGPLQVQSVQVQTRRRPCV